ncbi:MAG: hypothetical protein HC839_02190, partial [Leptolyngbyaceae cyanobacterium RM2_2_21]|nr:hypothetical protein [Leptolyngbyaceae cyanobacterium RM2_2_21]
MKRLAGLVKYAISNRDGQVSLPMIAALMAAREATVRAGLAALEARRII